MKTTLHALASKLIAKCRMVLLVLLTLLYGLNNPATGQTFSNTLGITGAQGVSTPNYYPSNVTVSGMTGNVSQVLVAVNGLTSTSLTSAFSLLLVGPGGQNLVLVADEGFGGGSGPSNASIEFADNAASYLTSNGNFVSGLYKPTSAVSSNPTFPSPAPAGPL